MDTIGRKTSLCSRHDRLTEFIGVGRHITGCIESWEGRLLATVDDEASFCIFGDIEMIDERGDR
jgi:hypothetical protein